MDDTDLAQARFFVKVSVFGSSEFLYVEVAKQMHGQILLHQW